MNKLKAFYNHPKTQSVLLTIACLYALLDEHVVLAVFIASACIAKAISETPRRTHIHQEFNFNAPDENSAKTFRAFLESLQNSTIRVDGTCPDKVEPKE